MVERHRGEIEPVEFQAPEASPPPPRPVAGQPVDRCGRFRPCACRADCIQQRDTRRREAEAVKKAEEGVLVPVEEWQTMWAEPHATLTTKGRVHSDKKLLELTRMEAVSEGVRVTASGEVSDLFGEYNVDLKGESTTEMEKLVKRFRDTLGPYVQLCGTETREFSFHGPLRSKTADARPAAPALLPHWCRRSRISRSAAAHLSRPGGNGGTGLEKRRPVRSGSRPWRPPLYAGGRDCDDAHAQIAFERGVIESGRHSFISMKDRHASRFLLGRSS